MSDRYWPATRAEFDRLEEIAYQKYLPLVKSLAIHELVGLSRAVRDQHESIRAEAHAVDVSRGARPPGTKVGSR